MRLARRTRVAALAVTPRADGSVDGMIERYRVETSRDGRRFTPVAEGTWSPGTATHTVPLPSRAAVRAVRLVALTAIGRSATVAELQLLPAG